MADEKNLEEQKGAEEQKTENKPPVRSGISRAVPWIIMAAVLIFCIAAGFKMGRLFAGRGQADSTPAGQSGTLGRDGQTVPTQLQQTSHTGAEKTWYYDLDPVVANLNEPGATRYVRVTPTLELAGDLEEKKGIAFFDQKKPLLKNWLTLYFANQTIEDTRGEKNLSRMQAQISDSLNQNLFAGAKPMIKRVLFKEFAIQ